MSDVEVSDVAFSKSSICISAVAVTAAEFMLCLKVPGSPSTSSKMRCVASSFNARPVRSSSASALAAISATVALGASPAHPEVEERGTCWKKFQPRATWSAARSWCEKKGVRRVPLNPLTRRTRSSAASFKGTLRASYSALSGTCP